MSNEEILEELMWEAYNGGFHRELLEKATEIMKKNPLISMYSAFESVFRELTQSK